MRGDWSSDAYPICCAFPVSQACEYSACSCLGEVLAADVHRSYLGICPHPHSKWCIQTHGTCHPDQLSDRPCQPHLIIAMVWRLPCVLILTSIFYIPRVTSVHFLQDKHSVSVTIWCTNIQCRPCIWYDGCGGGLFNRGTMTH